MLQIDFSGKTAVVTGASGQLGRVIARTLAQGGADVALCYQHNDTVARSVADDIVQSGRRAQIFQADVSDESSVYHMRDEIEKALGAPSIVVNCAVRQYKWKRVLDQPLEDYQSQFDTCVRQGVIMAKAFIPAMRARKYGRFIGINTECVMQCHPTQSAYVAGKRGMDGLYRILAREVGADGITVNQVAPGWTISDNDRQRHTEIAPEYASHVALGRRGTDQEIADAVAFLASDMASFITGVYLPVCGGYIMPTI